MNRSSAASIHSPRLSGLLQHVDVVQAAEQISQLATDIGCAFDCVRLVVGELSTVIETHESIPGCHTCVLRFVEPAVSATWQIAVPHRLAISPVVAL